jgi:hypothetical protein
MNEPTDQMTLTTDDHLALMLMTVWALYTGRSLPAGSPVLLTEQELLDFWAE